MKYRWKQVHFLVCDPHDVDEIWNLITGNWPSAVAFEYGYANMWIDTEEQRRRYRSDTESEVSYPLLPPRRRRLPKPEKIACGKSSFTIYATEPMWTIEKVRRASTLHQMSEYVSGCRIDFFRGSFQILDSFTRLEVGSSYEAPVRQTDDEPLSLDAGHIRARWQIGDRAAEKQVAAFLRQLKKFATNKIAKIDRSSLEVVERIERGGWTWVCPSALEWSRSHPLNFIDRRWKPIDWEPPASG